MKFKIAENKFILRCSGVFKLKSLECFLANFYNNFFTFSLSFVEFLIMFTCVFSCIARKVLWPNKNVTFSSSGQCPTFVRTSRA